MTSGHGTSHRRLFLGTIAVGLASVSGGVLFHRMRSGSSSKVAELPRGPSPPSVREAGRKDTNSQLPGEPLILPAKETARKRTLAALQISPDERQIAAVFGGITQQSVYVANFPPKQPSDYQLLAEFDNCYRVDGLNWNHADPTQLSCKMTEIRSKDKLATMVAIEQRQQPFNTNLVNDEDFAAYLCVLSTTGASPSRVCSLPSPSSQGAATAWASDGIVFCSERDRIERCSVESKDAKTIYHVEKWDILARSTSGIGAIQGVAWKPEQRELVALGLVLGGQATTPETSYFDREGKMLRKGVPAPWAARIADLSDFKMDASGNSLMALHRPSLPPSSTRKAIWGKLDSETTRELTLPFEEPFVSMCVSASGVAVLMYSVDSQQTGVRLVKANRAPNLDDFTFRVVSFA